MIDRNEIEGEVLGSIDNAFKNQWWNNLGDEVIERIRDNLCVVWEKYIPREVQQPNNMGNPKFPTLEEFVSEAERLVGTKATKRNRVLIDCLHDYMCRQIKVGTK